MIKPNEIISGKRKTAVAKLRFKDGTGKVFYNGLISTELNLFHKLALAEPVRICEQIIGPVKHDLFVKTVSGGKEGQVQAARVAIARELVLLNNNSEVLRKAYIAYDRNIIVQDSRRKEARKPGDSKARSKRQKSYR